MMGKLWQILLKLQKEPAEAKLTCDECFALLDYLVSQTNIDPQSEAFKELARKHHRYCSGCREHHLQKLASLEADQLRVNKIEPKPKPPASST